MATASAISSTFMSYSIASRGLVERRKRIEHRRRADSPSISSLMQRSTENWTDPSRPHLHFFGVLNLSTDVIAPFAQLSCCASARATGSNVRLPYPVIGHSLRRIGAANDAGRPKTNAGLGTRGPGRANMHVRGTAMFVNGSACCHPREQADCVDTQARQCRHPGERPYGPSTPR